MKNKVRLIWGGNREAQRQADEAFAKLSDHKNLNKRKKRKERKARRAKAREEAEAVKVAKLKPVVLVKSPKKKRTRNYQPARVKGEFRKMTAEFNRLVNDTD